MWSNNDNKSSFVSNAKRAFLRRFSARNFEPYTLSRQEVEDFIDVINFAPTSMNAHPYSACMVTDQKLKEQIGDLLKQPQIKTCSCLAVFNLDPTSYEISFSEHPKNFDIETKFNTIITAVGDASIGAAALHDYAIMSGFACCYIGAVKWKIKEIQKILKLPSNVIPVLGLCVGKTSEQSCIKPRLNKTFHNDDYSKLDLMVRMTKYDALMDIYYKERYPEKESLAFFRHIYLAHTLDYKKNKGIDYSEINLIPNLYLTKILNYKDINDNTDNKECKQKNK